MVLDGDRGGFAVIGRDRQGVERVEPNAESPLGLHANDFPVWPADSYEVLLDRRRGILLKYTALLDSAPYAGAEFSEVAFDVELPDDTFSVTESPDGHRWPARILMSVS